MKKICKVKKKQKVVKLLDVVNGAATMEQMEILIS